MNGIKTLEQIRAKLCLACVERIKFLREGKWKELKDEKEKNFLPVSFDDFCKFQNYEGAKKEAFNNFLDWLKKKKEEKLAEYLKDNILTEIEKNKNKLNENYSNFKNEFKFFNYTKDYSSHAKRLSQMIISNGLIPALAFYKSKGKDRGQIYQDISEILEVIEFKPFLDWRSKNQNKGLLEFLLDTDAQILRLTTTEVLPIANWLKRIVEIEIKE